MPSGIYVSTLAVPKLENLTSWTDSIWIYIPSANINNNQGILATTYADSNGFETGYVPGYGMHF